MPAKTRSVTVPANTIIEITASGSRSGVSASGKRKPVELKHVARKAGTFDRYITQLVKRVDCEMSLSAKSVAVLDGMLTDLGNHICIEAGQITRYNKRTTVTERDAQAAVMLVLKGEIGKKALTEGWRAIQIYDRFKAVGSSTSEKCQLVFPVPRVSTMLKSKTNLRQGLMPAIFITAALEYIASEIVELAGKALKEVDRSRILPRHIKMVIDSDSELNKVFANSNFING